MTFAVLAPERRLQPLGLGLAVLIGLAPLTAFASPSEPDPSSPDPAEREGGAIDDGPDTPEPEPDPEQDGQEPDSEPDPDPDPEPIRPPRVDGPYVGAVVMGTANFTKVLDLATPTPLFGGGAMIQAGDAVFPWMSIGIAAGGQYATVAKQTMFEGALLVELAFLPAPRYPLSIRTGFGFGGALFKGSVRYDFFPLAARKRPDRGGGWSIGPELGWLGATPSAKGQPFVNTLLLGLSTAFYFGG